ncbi:MAG: 30S ribosomal protein S4 [Candidatus Altarchaeaceae archaeon]
MHRLKKKFSRPRHPWRAERIKEERLLQQKYGLKNKKEIWRMLSLLSKWMRTARNLLVAGKEKEMEKEGLLNKLENLGLLKERSLSAVLNLKIEDVLERRLQTIVYRKGLAVSPTHARHFISHKHVRINGKVVNVPSKLIKKDEESLITCDITIITQENQNKEQSQQSNIQNLQNN